MLIDRFLLEIEANALGFAFADRTMIANVVGQGQGFTV
jgi:hypothetical protein